MARNLYFGGSMFLSALLAIFLQFAAGQAVGTPLDRLRAKTPVDMVANLTPEQLAGQYKNPSNELIKRIGGVLSGNSLYLFPDNSYIYCEWSDISPDTIYDKGEWVFSAGVLQLSSDRAVAWDPNIDRTLLAVRRPAHPKEILLMGMEKGLPDFEEEAGRDPEFALLLVARARDKEFSRAESSRLKRDLIRSEWHPDLFRAKH